MKAVGIIAEYNPFHNGHAYQLREARHMGATHLAVVMSGNFTQRGEPAICDKWTRARMALECGADLVIEIPVPFACAPARDFAAAGVFLLSQLPIDTLCFGCECQSLSHLCAAARAVEQAERHPMMKRLLDDGVSYIHAREQAVWEIAGETAAEIIRQPNNALGIEYLRAIGRLCPQMAAWAIPRSGAGHHDERPNGAFASASYLRSQLQQGNLPQLSEWMPKQAFEILLQAVAQGRAVTSLESFSRLLLASLRTATPEQLRQFRDVKEGVEFRILRASKEAASLDDLLKRTATKRYSRARMRRCLLACLLKIPQAELASPPQYLRILACNPKGRELLQRARKRDTVPVTPKFAQLSHMGFSQAKLEAQATDLYALMTEKAAPGNWEFTQNPWILL